MKEKIPSKDKEFENNQERVKKLHKNCRDLLEEFGDTPLKPEGSYIITPIKKIDENLNIRLSTDSISGGTLDREKALDGPLFVYVYRKNTKENSEHIKLIELNPSGKYKIGGYLEENGRLHREEITLSDSQVLENCEGFIARLQCPT
ncbi:hypothetical protein COY29_01320 [Candidatus Woesebacteria bacterium CG_4_10_14_0_2_um_filter_39_14]|uniref:Uncharacterized protein n=3 Tax=Microgenomates group TaxID=1794810 RepID=A0A2M6YPV7_9BACT|nr:MAG: hypothetical protein COT04_01450 [Candidatus Shapirobacteria bacterium CG07_land_8_20_14_0_80_39_12]PIZ49690.1 MAG: hypothetical protein COY29_01320 [Candidatus Woesebacteria bacterium CG_4_10_14_0_2_um_filter_39_14]PJA49516.1 MAG: hypothetical protein CO169_01795 [Candidatus Shapirobacteria bacterium CG_4_9_14_3_um_filter_39_13]